MKKIAINIKNNKVHLKDCYYIDQNGETFMVFQNISIALDNEMIKTKRRLHLCKKCIDNKKNQKKNKDIINAVKQFNKRNT